MSFDRAIMVDWSAAASIGPATPTKDRCWLACADRATPEASRPPAEYFRTRHACMARVDELCAACPGRVLVGFDFPLGYPEWVHDMQNNPGALPVAGELCAWLAGHLTDSCDGKTNRFEVAADINRRLHLQSGGPLWGRPVSTNAPGVTVCRPPVVHPEFRLVEQALQSEGRRPHSCFKLYTAGSVGSQMLTGLAALGRWRASGTGASRRVRLWPFETRWAAHTGKTDVVVAEIWPSLYSTQHQPGPCRDAKQVVAARNAIMKLADPFRAPTGAGATVLAAALACEGWVLGVQELRGMAIPDFPETRARRIRITWGC